MLLVSICEACGIAVMNDGQVFELTLLATQLQALLEVVFDKLLEHEALLIAQVGRLDHVNVVLKVFVSFVQLILIRFGQETKLFLFESKQFLKHWLRIFFIIYMVTFAWLMSSFAVIWLLLGATSTGTEIKVNSLGSIRDQWVPFMIDWFWVTTIGLFHRFKQSAMPTEKASSSIPG